MKHPFKKHNFSPAIHDHEAPELVMEPTLTERIEAGASYLRDMTHEELVNEGVIDCFDLVPDVVIGGYDCLLDNISSMHNAQLYSPDGRPDIHMVAALPERRHNLPSDMQLPDLPDYLIPVLREEVATQPHIGN